MTFAKIKVKTDSKLSKLINKIPIEEIHKLLGYDYTYNVDIKYIHRSLTIYLINDNIFDCIRNNLDSNIKIIKNCRTTGPSTYYLNKLSEHTDLEKEFFFKVDELSIPPISILFKTKEKYDKFMSDIGGNND